MTPRIAPSPLASLAKTARPREGARRSFRGLVGSPEWRAPWREVAAPPAMCRITRRSWAAWDSREWRDGRVSRSRRLCPASSGEDGALRGGARQPRDTVRGERHAGHFDHDVLNVTRQVRELPKLPSGLRSEIVRHQVERTFESNRAREGRFLRRCPLRTNPGPATPTSPHTGSLVSCSTDAKCPT